MGKHPFLFLVSLLVLSPLRAGAAEEQSGTEAPVRVTWKQALERVLARNPSSITAEQEIVRADALVRQARGAWLPTLSANGSYQQLNAARVFDGTVTTPERSWNGNLLLNLPLLAPLAWVNDAHAQDNRTVAVASAVDVRRQLSAAVGRTYLTVVLQHREVEVAERARATAAAHYDYAHTRMLTGLGNGVDDARAEQELHTNEAQVKTARTALVRAQSALALLLSEKTLVDAADDDVDLATPQVGTADEAAARRPDVRTQQARREATAHLRRDDWAYYAPTLLAQAQAFQETLTPFQPGNGWQAALVLSIPLFDGGVRYGIQRERRASDVEAQASLDALLRQVSVEIRTALEVVHNADDGLAASRAAATSANTAALLADKSYRAGASTNIEVVDAERQARDAASQVALAEDAARQARLDLLLATGAFP
jgi:outer membrane protein TolC